MRMPPRVRGGECILEGCGLPINLPFGTGWCGRDTKKAGSPPPFRCVPRWRKDQKPTPALSFEAGMALLAATEEGALVVPSTQ